MREIDLAVYADALAGESAALSARAERIRSKLRQAQIERRARNDLTAATVDRLESLGLLGGIDQRSAHAELRELEDSLAALEELKIVGRKRASGLTGNVGHAPWPAITLRQSPRSSLSRLQALPADDRGL